MPIYEYVCEDCNRRYERLILWQDTRISCPHCGSERHALQLSVFRTRRNDLSSSTGESPAAGCGCSPATCGCK